MNKIYCFINEAQITDWNTVLALAEDGHLLTSHISSSRYFAMHDIGVTSDWHHEVYKEHYPDGYEMVWLDEPLNDEGFKAAAKKNEELGKDGEMPKEQQAGVTVTFEEDAEDTK